MHRVLAFYINGSLDDAERRAVVQALAGNAELRREAEILRALRCGIQSRELPTPGELGLKRLRCDLKREREPAMGRRWRLIAIAAMLLLSVQTVVMFVRPVLPRHYAPLSGPPARAAVLQLGLAAGATAAEIAHLLRSINARIVDGPGAGGLYRIALRGDGDIGQALVTLQAHPEIVSYLARE